MKRGHKTRHYKSCVSYDSAQSIQHRFLSPENLIRQIFSGFQTHTCLNRRCRRFIQHKSCQKHQNVFENFLHLFFSRSFFLLLTDKVQQKAGKHIQKNKGLIAGKTKGQ